MPEESDERFDMKSILIGFVVGCIALVLIFCIIVNGTTQGYKSRQENKTEQVIHCAHIEDSVAAFACVDKIEGD